MRDRTEKWLSSLGSKLPDHERILRGLLREAAGDPRIRLLLVGCSIGRGAADRLSDIDAYLGVSEEAWPDHLSTLDAVLERSGELVDRHHQMVHPEGVDAKPYHQTFAQYRSGVQLDLAVSPAPGPRGPRPDWIVLYDLDGRVRGEVRTSAVTADDVRRWMYGGLVRLSACHKYLVRGSLWEALEQLHLARGDLWRLWAAAQRVPDAQYGLTAVLDVPHAPILPGIERTVASLDRAQLTRAALNCLDLLVSSWPQAIRAVAGEASPPPPLADWVRDGLELLDDSFEALAARERRERTRPLADVIRDRSAARAEKKQMGRPRGRA